MRDLASSSSRVQPHPRDHSIVPLTRRVPMGTLDPLRFFRGLVSGDSPAFILESREPGSSLSRYSYVGFEPALLPLPEGDPLQALRRVAQEATPRGDTGMWTGGAVGYLGYETAGYFERLPRAAGDAPPLPEAAFLRVDNVVVFDQVERTVTLVANHRPGSEGRDRALARLDQMERALNSDPPRDENHERAGPADDGGWSSNMSKAAFERMVVAAKEHIAAGDIFQVVLSQRFEKDLDASPLDVYAALRRLNPSPYLFYLSFGEDRQLVGASPELLVRVRGSRVETRPLAGTRPRGADAETDTQLERELLGDPKERAEHVMLVDLGRNDVGRVARAGSVQVEKLMGVERFSHVMHISSTVSGTLREDCDSLDALRAAFPAGTVSGAPKIRAMEIIAALEPDRRGAYAGAVGHIGFGGDLDMAITLRTLSVASGHAYLQAGAGIVADSDPAREYAETVAKASAVMEAVRQAEAAV